MCLNTDKKTDRGQDLGLGDEAVGQLDARVAVGGDDLCPGNLVTSQPLMGKDCGHVPAKDGCHVAALDLKGRCKVGRLHCNLLMGHS